MSEIDCVAVTAMVFAVVDVSVVSASAVASLDVLVQDAV